ncbi:hypothetical protein Franean1_1314 [Parafrankia sp. EAN1pec]|nr:hypothetical protein Franean1_1314 [Frankia sp. EAN1pec]
MVAKVVDPATEGLDGTSADTRRSTSQTHRDFSDHFLAPTELLMILGNGQIRSWRPIRRAS